MILAVPYFERALQALPDTELRPERVLAGDDERGYLALNRPGGCGELRRMREKSNPMKRIITIALALALAHASLFAQWANGKNTKVAMLDIVSRVKDEDIDTPTLTERLQVAFVDKNDFKIVERSLIGKLAGADKVMLSSISRIADKYILIIKAVDVSSGVVELSDQVMSYSIEGFIDVFPTIADRFSKKARGIAVPAYSLPAGRNGEGGPGKGRAAGGPGPRARPASIPREGLIAEWRFDGGPADTSGFGNHGIEHNITYVNARMGGGWSAAFFNGANSHIDIPNSRGSLHSDRAITLCVWIQVPRFGVGDCPVVIKAENNWGHDCNLREYAIIVHTKDRYIQGISNYPGSSGQKIISPPFSLIENQ